MVISPALADEGSLPGSSLLQVIDLAKEASPLLRARGLDADAARVRVEIDSALPDPMLRVTSDEIDRTFGPRQNKMIYSIEQEIPLWGRRELRRSLAQTEINRRIADRQMADAELVEKVKVSYAEYYKADTALREVQHLHGALHGLASLARERYAVGKDSLQEIFKAEADSTRTQNDITRLTAEHRASIGRLNALLGRPLSAPLAPPSTPRAIPPKPSLDPDKLLELAARTSPVLSVGNAAISASEHQRRLADLSRYPDLVISAGAIDRSGNGPNGFMAGIGFKIPLQWDVHSAGQREARLKEAASRADRDAMLVTVAGDLAEIATTLVGTIDVLEAMKSQLLAQTQGAADSALAAYRSNRGDLMNVLHAKHDLADLRLKLLDLEFDVQRQLAAIERLVGEDL